MKIGNESVMSMSFGLGANLKLGTSQKLTPQMQQAIKLLQMSSLELEQEIQIQLEKNPMLEREESGEDLFDQADNLEQLNNLANEKNSSTNDAPEIADTFDKLSDATFDDSAMDTNWENVYTSAPNSLIGSSEEEVPLYLGSTSSSIQDHVRWQINFRNLSETDNMIADYLIDSMDDSGFITLDMDELYNSLRTIASFYQWEQSIEKDEILSVLDIIQSCDPLGIGARDLTECLSIQLNKLDHDTPYLNEARLLLNHCHYLQTNNINGLLSETGLKIDVIQPSLELIRTMNPSPGQAYMDSQPNYGTGPESYDIPDVLVAIHYEADASKNDSCHNQQKADDLQPNSDDVVWEVRLNPDILPKLRINQEYANLVRRGDNSPDNIYLKENLSDAKLFLRSIQERNHNLLKVATCIVKRQEQFLLSGATAMQPLILKEVAEEVGLHESTVSRLTTSKSMLTPQGLFSLKHFFSSSVSGSEGDVSSTAICAMIEDLVKNENPKKPLSDSAIVLSLNKQGIDVARRTVAKYREQLNIGSSTQRKQRY